LYTADSLSFQRHHHIVLLAYVYTDANALNVALKRRLVAGKA
jgi:hypothetical protein